MEFIFSLKPIIVSILVFIIVYFIFRLCITYAVPIVIGIVILIFGGLGHNYAFYYWKLSKVPQFAYIEVLKNHSRSSYSESVLIKEVPNDKEALKKMMINYRDSVGVKLDSIEDVLTKYYSMSFYRYNYTTSLMLGDVARKDPNSYAYELLTEEDQLGAISSQRCTDDSSKWNTEIWIYYKKKYSDVYDTYNFTIDTLVYQCRDK